MPRFSNVSKLEQSSGMDFVRKPRYHCTFLWEGDIFRSLVLSRENERDLLWKGQETFTCVVSEENDHWAMLVVSRRAMENRGKN